MINLFHIPNYKIDTSKFDNLVNGSIVGEFEQAFAKYVGAKYAVAVNSCTNGIFLALKSLQQKVTCTVPSLVTTRFLNAIEMAGCDYEFTDKARWVGNDYQLYAGKETTIEDSAQRVSPNQYETTKYYKGLVIYSFYPTKPVGGIQGGMIVSNDKDRIDWIRQAAHFGEKLSDSTKSWESSTDFKGWQMFMGTIPAYIAFENLKRYPEKREALDKVREQYNNGFNSEIKVTTSSYHLYRIRTTNNDEFVKKMHREGVITGIHYKPAHMNSLYGKGESLPNSEKDGREVVSIPFHEKLTDKEINKIIKLCKKYL